MIYCFNYAQLRLGYRKFKIKVINLLPPDFISYSAASITVIIQGTVRSLLMTLSNYAFFSVVVSESANDANGRLCLFYSNFLLNLIFFCVMNLPNATRQQHDVTEIANSDRKNVPNSRPFGKIPHGKTVVSRALFIKSSQRWQKQQTDTHKHTKPPRATLKIAPDRSIPYWPSAAPPRTPDLCGNCKVKVEHFQRETGNQQSTHTVADNREVLILFPSRRQTADVNVFFSFRTKSKTRRIARLIEKLGHGPNDGLFVAQGVGYKGVHITAPDRTSQPAENEVTFQLSVHARALWTHTFPCVCRFKKLSAKWALKYFVRSEHQLLQFTHAAASQW